MTYKISRRRFGQLAIATSALAALYEYNFAKSNIQALAKQSPAWQGGNIPKLTKVNVNFQVNGTKQAVEVDSRMSLLDCLREKLKLTGSKKGCDHGQCGACTVMVNGRRINSCLTFACMHEGDEITTIEGLAKDGNLHPMQEAFIAHDGFQCGYCTPGQIMSAVALLSETCGKQDSDVAECMSGNICRCAAYPNIVAAIQEVRKGKVNASL
jgi:xanthine dehydrogenase YagT iron-sulfur-binding subunit